MTLKIRHELFCRFCDRTRNMRITQSRGIFDKILAKPQTRKQYNCRVCGNFIKEVTE